MHCVHLQANHLYLKGVAIDQVEVLLCPQSPEEKQLWVEKTQFAG